MKKIFTIFFLLLSVSVNFATISWMGNSSVSPSNPTADQNITFYVEMWDSYNGCHAEVVIDLFSDGSDWTAYNMPYKDENGNNSAWETIIILPEGTHTFYYHGWDDWGANVYDNNGGANFTIIVDAALPVELTTFSAAVLEKEVMLSWKTATEVNNYGFEIQKQRLEENVVWQKIGFVEGYGNSNSPKEYSFSDNAIALGKYQYRLKQIDIDGKFEYSDIVEVNYEIPTEFSIDQNYPNPFNPSTTIQFSLPEAGDVKIDVFNSIGEKVSELVNKKMDIGVHHVDFKAANLNSGIYVYSVQFDNVVMFKKMILLK